MGCMQSLLAAKYRHNSDPQVEALTLRRRITKKINDKHVKIAISVVTEEPSSTEADGSVCQGQCQGHDHVSVHLHMDHYGRSSKSAQRRKYQTVSFSEGKRYMKFPNSVGYRMCKGCSKHGQDVLKTKASKGDKELCRSCSVKHRGRKKKGTAQTDVTSLSPMSNLLAMTALDLTAPASDAVLKNRKNTWIQLAGHPGGFAPAGPNTIWKKLYSKDNNETRVYEELMEDSAHSIVPVFYREVEYNSEYFIEIEDLLQQFHDPNIMDVKMGTRTFLESEVRNPVLRKDLYEKMVALDADAPTQEERENKAITKLRYMQFREQGSSTLEFGFRIEALRMSGEPTSSNLKKVKSKEQLHGVLSKFLAGHQNVQQSLVRRLEELRDVFETSPFFNTHEIIGSSILMLYDQDGKCGAWIIDFSKTIPVESGSKLTHRSPWQLGNHEDGFLFGVDSIIQLMSEMEVKSTCSVPVLDPSSSLEKC